MLRVIVTLDCNMCGQPFEHLGSSSSLDPLEWKSLSLDLEHHAESSGWFFFRAAHYCDYCASTVEFALLAHNAFENNPLGRRPT